MRTAHATDAMPLACEPYFLQLSNLIVWPGFTL
jgi:hypothetical protein